MKSLKFLSFFCVMFFLSEFATAQISQGGKPLSFSNDLKSNIPSLVLDAPNMASINAEDAQRASLGKIHRIGVMLKADVNPSTSGVWNFLPDGSAIWRLKINSENAEALGLYFDNFNMPEGAKLFAYTPDREFVIGAFTSFNNTETGTWATQMIPGDEVVVELFLANANDEYSFELAKVCYFYRSTGMNKNSSKNSSGSCNVNIACSEGSAYADESNGVVKIQMPISGGYVGLCTGSLVNNTNGDCKSYVLSADHCSADPGRVTTASEYNQWVFYFKYQSNSCSGSSYSYGTKTMTGCTHRASDNFGETNSDYANCSDFLLVELKNSVPATYDPYYNGWTTENVVVPANSICIHHPQGDIKKISTVDSDFFTEAYGNNLYPNQHYISWKQTTNGYGITEGGSSGSPLFNTSGLIAGTLTGGTTACESYVSQGVSFGPDKPDLFGRMSKHWTSNGTTSDKQLKPWLNPGNSSVTQLNGRGPCVVGLSDLQYVEANISTFPNPANNILNVDFSNYNTQATIYVSDILGTMVSQPISGEFTGIQSIDVSNLASGMYYVVITSDQGKIAKQFVKE